MLIIKYQTHTLNLITFKKVQMPVIITSFLVVKLGIHWTQITTKSTYGLKRWNKATRDRRWHLQDYCFNTLRPRQNGRHFADDIFECIFLNENVWISIKISLKFVPKGSISNIPALVQKMACRRLGDKPLSEPMLACSPTHICVSRPQWINDVPSGVTHIDQLQFR